MAFPQTPREIIAELFINGGWQDITSDVYQRAGIEITRGAASEASKTQPSTCRMTLDNTTGNYSSRNPLGAYYGQLKRNTPLRVGIVRDSQDFSVNATDSWGTTDQGNTWTLGGTGGTVADSDFQVTGGKGTQSLVAAATNLTRYAVTSQDYLDVDVTVTWTLPFTNVTGGSLNAGILLRWNGSDGYRVRTVIDTAEDITIALLDYPSGDTIASAVATGLTHSSSQAVKIRAQVEGQSVRCKAWAATEDEPHDWPIAIHTEAYTAAGKVGVISGIVSGNTNTRPVVFSYDDFQVVSNRFIGEVANWPAKTDVTGNDKYVEIEAAGLLRRISQGDAPVESPFKRATQALTDLVAYWPMEEDKSSSYPQSGMPDGSGTPMTLATQTLVTKWAENSDILASKPLPDLNGNVFSGAVPAYTDTDKIQVRLLMVIPVDGYVDGTTIFRMENQGTAFAWHMLMESDGDFTLQVSSSSATLHNVTYNFNKNGQAGMLSLSLAQDGADVDFTIGWQQVGSTVVEVSSGTVSACTIGSATGIQLGSSIQPSYVLGHLAIRKDWTSPGTGIEALRAHDTENAGRRWFRVLEENGFNGTYFGDVDATPMGPQPIVSVLDITEECSDANFGVIYEARGRGGILGYHERSALYSQAPVATITYSAGELAHPFEPVDDDRFTKNDILYKRKFGGEYRVEDTTGPLSTADPAEGGVGLYDVQITRNTSDDNDNIQYANWALHLGTVDEPRFPSIRVNLGNRNVVANTTLSNALLDVDVNKVIRVDGASDIGFYDNIDQLVVGYTEYLNAFEHTIEFNCAPASPYSILELDGTTFSRLDSSSSTLTSDITSGATSVSVTSTAEVWTTTAGDIPFSVMVGGEEMSVTAVSGTTSPQTFTVTRAVNGVTKAHSAGAEVHVKSPVYLGL